MHEEVFKKFMENAYNRKMHGFSKCLHKNHFIFEFHFPRNFLKYPCISKLSITYLKCLGLELFRILDARVCSYINEESWGWDPSLRTQSIYVPCMLYKHSQR